MFSVISESHMHTNYPDTFLKWTHLKTRNTNVNYSCSTGKLHINEFKVKHIKFRRRIKYIHDFDTFLLIIYSYLTLHLLLQLTTREWTAAVAQSVKHSPNMWKVGCSNPSRDRPKSISTCSNSSTTKFSATGMYVTGSQNDHYTITTDVSHVSM